MVLSGVRIVLAIGELKLVAIGIGQEGPIAERERSSTKGRVTDTLFRRRECAPLDSDLKVNRRSSSCDEIGCA